MRVAGCLVSIAVLICLIGCTGLQGLLGHAPPTAAVHAEPITGRAPLHVEFDGTASHGMEPITNFAWAFGDGSTSQSFGTSSHEYTSPGVYPATLTVMNSQGEENSLTITVTVENTPPVANCRFSSDAPLIGELIQLDATGSIDSDGVIVDVQWDLGDGTSLRGSRASHVYETADVYTLRLTVVDDLGGMDTVEHTMTVHLGSGSGGGCGGRSISISF